MRNQSVLWVILSATYSAYCVIGVVSEHWLIVRCNMYCTVIDLTFIFAFPLLPYADWATGWRAGCTTVKAACSTAVKICVTVWPMTAWAASCPVLNAAHASVVWSAAVTGSGRMSRWRWKVETSSSTSSCPRFLLERILWYYCVWWRRNDQLLNQLLSCCLW